MWAKQGSVPLAGIQPATRVVHPAVPTAPERGLEPRVRRSAPLVLPHGQAARARVPERAAKPHPRPQREPPAGVVGARAVVLRPAKVRDLEPRPHGFNETGWSQ